MDIWTQHLRDSFQIKPEEKEMIWDDDTWNKLIRKERVGEKEKEKVGLQLEEKEEKERREDKEREERNNRKKLEFTEEIMQKHAGSFITKAVKKLKEKESIIFRDFKNTDINKAIKHI